MAAVFPYPVGVRLPFGLAGGGPARDDADAAEVGRAASGDDAAFEALVVRHQRSLYNLSVRLLGDREEARDAVQEAFLRAWRGLPRFRGEASFRTWATGIVINVCRNRLASADAQRRRKTSSLARRDQATGDEAALPLPDPAPGPEARAQGSEVREALATALAGLTAEHREIILLREMHDLEYEEIAAALGCAVGTVRSRLARARGALRRALEGVWP
jgi:RNA polymerase sigma factor (sigma-70 family)